MRKTILWIITLLLVLLTVLWCAEAKDKKTIKKDTYSIQQKRAIKQKANPDLVNKLWNSCSKAVSKKLIDNKRVLATKSESQIHCFWLWLSNSKAESQMGNDKSNHWYFGFMGSKDKSADNYVKTYNKVWYKIDKYNAWRLFYGSKNKIAPTRYCLSEDSSNTKWRCPNGQKNFDTIYQPYKKLFIDKQKVEEYVKDPKRPPKIIYPYKSKIKWKK